MTSHFDAYTIGFDRILNMFNEIQNQTAKAVTYPPYNVKKTGDNTYLIEMAVAGFGKQDIEVVLEDNVLKITGSVAAKEDDKNWIFKGIATRPFTRTFTLADTVVVANAELVNGMLRVFLNNVLPQKKSKKIDISDGNESTGLDYGYLTE